MSIESEPVVGETLLELLSYVINAAFDGTSGEVHLGGDFVVFIPRDEHHERNAVHRVELLNGVRDLGSAVEVLGRFGCEVVGDVYQVCVVGIVVDG